MGEDDAEEIRMTIKEQMEEKVRNLKAEVWNLEMRDASLVMELNLVREKKAALQLELASYEKIAGGE